MNVKTFIGQKMRNKGYGACLILDDGTKKYYETKDQAISIMRRMMGLRSIKKRGHGKNVKELEDYEEEG